MRIAINALSVQGGGGLTFLKNLLEHLLGIDLENQYFIFVTEDKVGALGIPQDLLNLRIIICPPRKWFVRACWEQVILPRILHRERVDVLYAPANQGPIFSPIPFVVLVQNVDPLVQGGRGLPLVFRVKRWGLRLMTQLSIQKARKVIAISDYTRRLLVQEFGSDPKEIAVIPHGAPNSSECFRPLRTEERFGGEKKIKSPYLLAVSNIGYNKNYETLIQAFAIASRTLDVNVGLVIAGERGPKKYFDRLLRHAHAVVISSRVHFLGGVSYEQMPALYAGARALVYPSLVESFGLPPLEAMAYGLPVAASRIDPIIEVCNDAVLYFDPHSAEEMAKVIVQVVSDDLLRATLIEKGLARARRFSWEDTARSTLEILKAAS